MGTFDPGYNVYGQYPAHNQSYHLRARQGLSYLQFIDLVKNLWEKDHPDIQIVPEGGDHEFYSQRGYIVYDIMLRKPMSQEPKPKHREEIFEDTTGKVFIIKGQRFINLISFAACHKNPRVAEEIIEAFEDFMSEFTYIFKQLGLSDFFYDRRTADMNDPRDNHDISRRTVVYQAIFEKVTAVDVAKLEEIEIWARVFLQNYDAIRETVDNSEHLHMFLEDQQATPNY